MIRHSTNFKRFFPTAKSSYKDRIKTVGRRFVQWQDNATLKAKGCRKQNFWIKEISSTSLIRETERRNMPVPLQQSDTCVTADLSFFVTSGSSDIFKEILYTRTFYACDSQLMMPSYLFEDQVTFYRIPFACFAQILLIRCTVVAERNYSRYFFRETNVESLLSVQDPSKRRDSCST